MSLKQILPRRGKQCNIFTVFLNILNWNKELLELAIKLVLVTIMENFAYPQNLSYSKTQSKCYETKTQKRACILTGIGMQMVGLMPALKYCRFLPFYFSNGSDIIYSNKLFWGLTILPSSVNSWFSFFPQLLPMEIKMLPSVAKSVVVAHHLCFVQLSWTDGLGKIPVNDILLIALHGDYNPRKLSGQK